MSAKFSNYGIEQIEIRGEVLMNKNNFKKYNEKLDGRRYSTIGQSTKCSSRSLRIKDTAEVGRRNLEAFYTMLVIITDNDQISQQQTSTPQTHSGMLEMLWKLGFQKSQKRNESGKRN